MLESGPLVGMVQIPGIKFGVKDVVTLATLNSAIEDALESMSKAGLIGLEEQTDFLAQCLNAWLEASGRKHDISDSDKLDPDNVAYQGRVLVSALTLLPACIVLLRSKTKVLTSSKAEEVLIAWFKGLMQRAGLIQREKFLAKGEFRKKGFLGSGGIGRFRDTLWAASLATRAVSGLSDEKRAMLASEHRTKVCSELGAR